MADAITVTSLLMTAVGALGAVIAKLWTIQQKRHESEIANLTSQLNQERADRKAAEKELASKSELFLKALHVKRSENSPASEPPSRMTSGVKIAP